MFAMHVTPEIDIDRDTSHATNLVPAFDISLPLFARIIDIWLVSCLCNLNMKNPIWLQPPEFRELTSIIYR